MSGHRSTSLYDVDAFPLNALIRSVQLANTGVAAMAVASGLPLSSMGDDLVVVRESTAPWFESQLPRLLDLFTGVQRHAALVAGLSPEGVDRLLADWGTPHGRQEFREAGQGYADDARAQSARASDTAAEARRFLVDFDTDLSSLAFRAETQGWSTPEGVAAAGKRLRTAAGLLLEPAVCTSATALVAGDTGALRGRPGTVLHLCTADPDAPDRSEGADGPEGANRAEGADRPGGAAERAAFEEQRAAAHALFAVLGELGGETAGTALLQELKLGLDQAVEAVAAATDRIARAWTHTAERWDVLDDDTDPTAVRNRLLAAPDDFHLLHAACARAEPLAAPPVVLSDRLAELLEQPAGRPLDLVGFVATVTYGHRRAAEGRQA
ncbi:hypothetical protein JGS22_005790 [Streptomyces sp. P38-E01]|uniref:Uncharacterized protein n=1 Tax=Streptomyces tardus TaxID=2780544 RepID=A0A949N4P0_9ACTN|nr:hypothetical protein [Streptomyces tardus]MBU7597157.1 hypothetical protein [Streptomyces tardus]